MKIYVNAKGQEKDIVIEGKFQFQEDIAYFFQQLKIGKGATNITFLDANMLPANVVEALWYLKGNVDCNIYVLQKRLYLYLSNLGIDCIYMQDLKPQQQREVSQDFTEDFSFEDMELFLQKISKKYGYNYTQYNPNSMCRRIKVAMKKLQIKTFEEFQAMVLKDIYMFREFFQELSINTTSFFRNPEVFFTVGSEVLPSFHKENHIKIWCVGCSSGQEPYSLAILLEEQGMLDRVQIYATDFNPYVIEEAKNGIYPIKTIEQDSSNYAMAGGQNSFYDYFSFTIDYMRIKNRLKKKILFFPHNAIDGGTLNEFQMVFCRNMFIYFNHQLQHKMLHYFYNCLERGGFLVLGKSEEIPQNLRDGYFYRYHNKNRIYQKI